MSDVNVGDTAINIFERCMPQVKTMLLTIQRQLHHFENDQQNLIDEARERWVECFEKYEEDQQYLHYMFVVMKNKIRDIRRHQYRYSNTHISDPNKISRPEMHEGAIGHVRVWNEMAVDKEPMVLESMLIQEQVDQIASRLTKDLHKQVFRLLASGIDHKEIAVQLGFSAGHIASIKAKHIWPIAKEVMGIDDEAYEILVSSGRIYYRA